MCALLFWYLYPRVVFVSFAPCSLRCHIFALSANMTMPKMTVLQESLGWRLNGRPKSESLGQHRQRHRAISRVELRLLSLLWR